MLYNANMDAFEALADPTRRKILELLAARGPLAATAISDKFPMSAAAVSQHLKVLREANLVSMEKRAQQRLYRVNTQAMSELEGWVHKLHQRLEERYERLDQVLEAEKKRLQEERKK